MAALLLQFEPEKREKKTKPKAVLKEDETRIEDLERTEPQCTLDTTIVRKSLGRLNKDREYLEKLMRDKGSKADGTETSKRIYVKACDGLQYLYSRAEFWNNQESNHLTDAVDKNEKAKKYRAKLVSRNTTDTVMKKEENKLENNKFETKTDTKNKDGDLEVKTDSISQRLDNRQNLSNVGISSERKIIVNKGKNASLLTPRSKDGFAREQQHQHTNSVRQQKGQKTERDENFIKKESGVVGLYKKAQERANQPMRQHFRGTEQNENNDHIYSRPEPECSIDKPTVRKALGKLNDDVEYFKKLLNEKGPIADNDETSKSLSDKAFGGLEYLYSRALFWSKQEPVKLDSWKWRNKRHTQKFKGVVSNNVTRTPTNNLIGRNVVRKSMLSTQLVKDNQVKTLKKEAKLEGKIETEGTENRMDSAVNVIHVIPNAEVYDEEINAENSHGNVNEKEIITCNSNAAMKTQQETTSMESQSEYENSETNSVDTNRSNYSVDEDEGNSNGSGIIHLENTHEPANDDQNIGTHSANTNRSQHIVVENEDKTNDTSKVHVEYTDKNQYNDRIIDTHSVNTNRSENIVVENEDKTNDTSKVHVEHTDKNSYNDRNTDTHSVNTNKSECIFDENKEESNETNAPQVENTNKHSYSDQNVDTRGDNTNENKDIIDENDDESNQIISYQNVDTRGDNTNENKDIIDENDDESNQIISSQSESTEKHPNNDQIIAPPDVDANKRLSIVNEEEDIQNDTDLNQIENADKQFIDERKDEIYDVNINKSEYIVDVNKNKSHDASNLEKLDNNLYDDQQNIEKNMENTNKGEIIADENTEEQHGTTTDNHNESDRQPYDDKEQSSEIKIEDPAIQTHTDFPNDINSVEHKNNTGSDELVNGLQQKMEEIDKDLTEGKYQHSLEIATETLIQVETYSDDEIPNRNELIAQLYGKIGSANMKMGNVEEALEYHKKALELVNKHGLDDHKASTLDNIGKAYVENEEYERALETWKDTVPSTRPPVERAWVYHEMGWCAFEIGKYSDAKDYGERSLEAAEESGESNWQLHASVLVAQSQAHLHDYKMAKETFEKALALAREQDNTEVEDALAQALVEMEKKLPDPQDLDNEKEETDMLSIIDEVPYESGDSVSTANMEN